MRERDLYLMIANKRERDISLFIVSKIKIDERRKFDGIRKFNE